MEKMLANEKLNNEGQQLSQDASRKDRSPEHSPTSPSDSQSQLSTDQLCSSSSHPHRHVPESHHHHHDKHTSSHYHFSQPERSENAGVGVQPPIIPSPQKAESAGTPRELLVLSPTKIVIRDPIKSVVRKKAVAHCGVQVNRKRRTESKRVQTSNVNMAPEPLEQTVGMSDLLAKSAVESEICAAKKKTVCMKNISTQTSSKEKLHTSVSQHNQHSVRTVPSMFSASRLLSESEPIPECVRLAHSCYRKYVHLEKYTNGGALVAHAYHHELQKLSQKEQDEFADLFLELVYGEETEGVSHCVMGIVHDAASPMEDFLDYLCTHHKDLIVKAGVLGKSDIESTTITKYRESVQKHYQNGTFRWGPLLQISLVGTVQEEVGNYFPEFLDMLEKDPFLRASMPWGSLSLLAGKISRQESNDGPILWSRPGEQMVPTADMPKSPFKQRKR